MKRTMIFSLPTMAVTCPALRTDPVSLGPLAGKPCASLTDVMQDLMKVQWMHQEARVDP